MSFRWLNPTIIPRRFRAEALIYVRAVFIIREFRNEFMAPYRLNLFKETNFKNLTTLAPRKPST